MLRPFRGENRIHGADRRDRLEQFLELALRVLIRRIHVESFKILARLREHDAARSHVVRVEVDCADERFVCVGERRAAFATAGGFLAAAHHQVPAEIEPLGVNFQAVARDEAGAHLGELPLAEFRKMIEQPLGEDELEHRIAEKFETLVVEVMPLRLVPDGRMRERLRKQERIAELVFQSHFERIHRRAGE